MNEFVTCKYCKKIEVNDPNIIVLDCDEDNKLIKGNQKYIHIDCKEKNLKEQEDMDKLVLTLIRIYNLQTSIDIPSLIYKKIQDIRNGTYKKGSIQFKQGYSYAVIEQAFVTVEPTIKWALTNKEFVVKVKNPENYMNKLIERQMLYGLAIVYDKLPQIYRNMQRMAAQKQLQKQKAQEKPKVEYVEEYQELVFSNNKEKKKKYDWLEDDD